MANKTNDPGRWLHDVVQSQQSFFKAFGTAEESAESSAAWTDTFDALRAWQLQSMRQLSAYWPDASGEPIADRRFNDDSWQRDPRFGALARTYLAAAQGMQQMVESSTLDEKSKAQMSFVLRQVLDAASPANSLATNPEAMQAALQSGGASLVEGMRLFLQDLAKGRVSMTDESAFVVGENVATTPGAVVFENELMQLIQYSPTTNRVYERPLVIVPPCINKYYILDLQPENSLVAYAVSEGHTVFVVSWRNAGRDQAQLKWDDYVADGVIKAIDTALSITGADRANALGFCIGGTLLACAAAVFASQEEKKLSSITLLTAMLDFFDTGEIGLLVNEPTVAAREATVGAGGLVMGSELAQVFAALRANDLVWTYVVNSYLKGKAPQAFDLLYWNSDATNLPGPMFCWYLRNTYLENKLRVPGATVQCGHAIDFGKVDVPSFIYASREDHIVPWETAYASTRLLGGESTFVLGASGHIAGVINPPSKNKRNFWIGDLASSPSWWLDSAKSVPGSWWPTWAAWLGEYSGETVKARKKLGDSKHPILEDAPGSYVKARAA